MTQSQFHNVAVVTGSGRGLGAAIASKLAREGYKVLVTDVDPDRANNTVAAIKAVGGEASAATLNVTSKADFDAALQTATELWGGVGVLVNNAALTRTTPIFDITPEEFSEILDINLRGTFLGCQVFGQYFKEQSYGRIVNMASLAGQNGGAATGAHYAASKGAIITLTKVFARDLAKFGVTANAISPGPLDVDLVREILPPEKLTSVVGSIPVGQLGDPDFIAGLVVLLASPQAASMTGSTLDANGGLYVR